MFHVGQKVVCVDDAPRKWDLTPSQLSKGSVYTLTSIVSHHVFGVGVTLAEVIPAPPNDGWHIERFRPVVTTDISIFQAMLVPTPKEKVLVTADDPGCERRE